MSYLVLVYGILVAIGGIMGYVKAKSKPSLVAGVICGDVLIGSGILMMKGFPAAVYVALGMAILLTGLFGKRFAQKGAFMPSGLMLLLSLVVTISLVIGLFM